jgi:hypothetical protein
LPEKSAELPRKQKLLKQIRQNLQGAAATKMFQLVPESIVPDWTIHGSLFKDKH